MLLWCRFGLVPNPAQAPPLSARIGCIVAHSALRLDNKWVMLSNSPSNQPEQVGGASRIRLGGGAKMLDSVYLVR